MRVLSLLVGALLCGMLVTTQTGCLIAAAAAGTGATVAYVRGETEASLPAGAEKVTAASKAVAEEMKLSIISCQSTALDGKLVARNAQDQKIVVTVKGEGDNVSRVSIRVDTFGDEALQNAVLDKIKSKLNAAPQVANTSG